MFWQAFHKLMNARKALYNEIVYKGPLIPSFRMAKARIDR